MAASDCAHRPITEERRHKFLATLAATGSPVAAARQATPWGSGRQAGYSSFARLRRTDPRFAEAWDDAIADALAMIETEIVDRAMHPPKRPVFEDGKVVGWTEDRNSSDRMLLRVAQKLDPAWGERQHHDVTGQVVHEHEHRMGTRLQAEHIDLLSKTEQDVFLSLLAKIDRLGAEEDGHERRRPALPAPDPVANEEPHGPAD